MKEHFLIIIIKLITQNISGFAMVDSSSTSLLYTTVSKCSFITVFLLLFSHENGKQKWIKLSYMQKSIRNGIKILICSRIRAVATNLQIFCFIFCFLLLLPLGIRVNLLFFGLFFSFVLCVKSAEERCFALVFLKISQVSYHQKKQKIIVFVTRILSCRFFFKRNPFKLTEQKQKREHRKHLIAFQFVERKNYGKRSNDKHMFRLA